jgi:hypothetical protein
MKKATLAASLLLVAGTSAACGGGGSPTDASQDDFCNVVNVDSIDTGKEVKDFVNKFEDVGTPKDMPADARAGFELFTGEAKKVKDDASQEDLQAIGTDLSDDDTKKVEAFFTYVGETCPADVPTPELPTPELPSAS